MRNQPGKKGFAALISTEELRPRRNRSTSWLWGLLFCPSVTIKIESAAQVIREVGPLEGDTDMENDEMFLDRRTSQKFDTFEFLEKDSFHQLCPLMTRP